MTYITTAYATRSATEQDICAEPVEILSLDDCLVSVAEWAAFERRLDSRLTYSQLLAHVCLDYELGCVDAMATLKRIEDNSLFRNPDHLMAVVAAGVRALAEGRGA